MTTLHLLSHTHWDREWYLTFQQFRLRLVHLVDGLLELMEKDPDFCYFMLDGQTVVLDDYLQVRPEQEDRIRRLVQEGRLLIGPWHVLPDEFLVSPEATLRNLLQGERTARRFGAKMPVGYIPDPFGHIGQMPQILQGFGIQAACLQRGLAGEPCELWWQAPDGSRVLLAYLRDGYGNGAMLLSFSAEDFAAQVRRLRDSLRPHAATSHILLMFGNDHMEPPANTSALIAGAREMLDGDRLVHTTLPAYIAAIQAEIGPAGGELPVVEGELRASKRHNLLPGVLSARVWIKQRNHACETLLEKWAEPFSVFAGLAAREAARPDGRLANPAPLLRHAWRILMECHPHDSICGCSIDAVHEEMRPRFDQAEQIAEEITRQSLSVLAAAVDTTPPGPVGEQAQSAVLVFNPCSGPRSDRVSAAVQLQAGWDGFDLLDESGRPVPYELESTVPQEVALLILDKEGMANLLTGMADGRVAGAAQEKLVLQDIRFNRQEDSLVVDAEMSTYGEPRSEALARAMEAFTQAFADRDIQRFVVHANLPVTHISFTARDVPAFGWRAFWIRPGGSRPAATETPGSRSIENEFFILTPEAGGTVRLLDRRTGHAYAGLNRFSDGGDRGDEYTYCPPKGDREIEAQLLSARSEKSPARQTLELRLALQAPASLSADRQGRSETTVPLPITTRLSLYPGVERVEVHTEVDNTAQDHRLRVRFPAPFPAAHALYDGHFEVVERPAVLPEIDPSWGELPVAEQPQRLFTAVSDGSRSLMIASRGLREAAVLPLSEGRSEVALTLLRCVGWLSRGDLSTRRSPAGPEFPTPAAQVPGKWSFDYAILPGSAELPYAQAEFFNAPPRAVWNDLHGGSLPASYSFVQHAPAEFVLSAVKAAEDGEGWVLRGYNRSAKPLPVRLAVGVPFAQAWRANLAEEMQAALQPGPGGVLDLTAGPHEIITLRFL